MSSPASVPGVVFAIQHAGHPLAWFLSHRPAAAMPSRRPCRGGAGAIAPRDGHGAPRPPHCRSDACRLRGPAVARRAAAVRPAAEPRGVLRGRPGGLRAVPGCSWQCQPAFHGRYRRHMGRRDAPPCGGFRLRGWLDRANASGRCARPAPTHGKARRRASSAPPPGARPATCSTGNTRSTCRSRATRYCASVSMTGCGSCPRTGC